MHDIDRTTLEVAYHQDEEFDFEDDYELADGEMEFESDDDEFEYEEEWEMESSYGNPFSEEEEMELAAELLAVSSDEELDQFLGKLFRKVKRGVRKLGRSKFFRGLGGALKKVAKVALPIAGKTLGTFFGGPAGGMIGGKLGSFATRLFELELEGMSPEDQEFEVARRFVRLAGAAATNTARISPRTPVRAAVKTAMARAAKSHAPGLLRKVSKTTRRSVAGRKKSGKWIKRNGKIVILGA